MPGSLWRVYWECDNIMPKQDIGVIPIRRDINVSKADREIVDLANKLWPALTFRGGSPETTVNSLAWGEREKALWTVASTQNQFGAV
jgi:hypothetical protein